MSYYLPSHDLLKDLELTANKIDAIGDGLGDYSMRFYLLKILRCFSDERAVLQVSRGDRHETSEGLRVALYSYTLLYARCYDA